MNKEEIKQKIEELKKLKEEAEQNAKLQDVFQHSYKIFLNSVYGFTGTPFSPVFNKDIAESVTLTGQAATKEMVKFTNLCLNKIGNTSEDNEWVIAGDTDSVASDSKIYVDGKRKTIEEAFDKTTGYVDKLENGTEVKILGKVYKTQSVKGECRIKNISRHKIKKQMYEIKIPNHNALIITKDHSIMVYRDGEIIECKPEDIRETDCFIVK